MTLRATITAFTHPGLERGGNQDTVGAGNWVGEGSMWQPWRARILVEAPLLCVVADGMGGHPAGDVASARAVRQLLEASSGMRRPPDVARALSLIDRGLHDHAAREPALAGMGTTVAGLVLAPERLIWFNVGDSRLYRHREGFLRQVSTDDVPGGQHRHGSGARRSHMLSASLGGSPQDLIEPHLGVEEPPTASRWLLCSDGLTDMLDLATMEAAMTGTDLEAWLALFAGVMEAGAVDNVSIVLVTLDAAEEAEARHAR